MQLDKLNSSIFYQILGVIFMIFPVVTSAQLFIGGEGIHIQEGAQIHIKDDLILDTDKISGKGEIVLSGDEKQTIHVKRGKTQLARITIKNNKGAEIKGKGHLVVSDEVYIAKGSSFSGKYLGNTLYQDKTINTQIALQSKKEEKQQEVQEEFVPQVLGYGHIINLTEVIRKTQTNTTKGLNNSIVTTVVFNQNDFINLPLINNHYYIKKSSDYNYTQTYQDEDYSNIFTPPKIG